MPRMLPFCSNLAPSLFLRAFLSISLLLVCCGDDSSSSNSAGDSQGLTKPEAEKITGSNVIFDDFYDVYLLTSNGSQMPNPFCTATKIYPGVFLTAAHCVIGSRPFQAASTWKVNYLFLTNKNTVNVSSGKVIDLNSIIVRTPPDTANYSNSQWLGNGTNPVYYSGPMIATDLAVITTNDFSYQYDNSTVFQGPANNQYYTLVGYGANNSTNNSGSGIKRQMQAVMTGGSVSNNLWDFMYVENSSAQPLPGDSGGPVYYYPTSSSTRKIVGVISYGSSNNIGTYAAVTSNGKYSSWLTSAYNKAVSESDCLRNKFVSSIDSCVGY